MEISHIVGGEIDGEASTGRSGLQTIIEADCWGIVEKEVCCGLADEAGHEKKYQAEAPHSASEVIDHEN